MLILLLTAALAATLELPPDSERLVERARLHPDVVTEADVRQIFVRDADNDPPLPSVGMLDDLVALADHPDRRVRMQIPEALWPWFAMHTQGPLPEGHESVVDEAVIIALAADPDKAVRRRTARLVKDARPGLLTPAVGDALLTLTEDEERSVRRTALATLAEAPRQGIVPGDVAWVRALDSVPQKGPPGRTACNTLAKLHKDLEPSRVVAPRQAVARCMLHHRERGWKLWAAWREEVPFDPNWADELLSHTEGFHGALVRHWADTAPEIFAEVLKHWQPTDERRQMMLDTLRCVEQPPVREAMGMEPVRAKQCEKQKAKVAIKIDLKELWEETQPPEEQGICLPPSGEADH